MGFFSDLSSTMLSTAKKTAAESGTDVVTFANSEQGGINVEKRDLGNGVNAYIGEDGQISSFSRVDPARPGMIQLYGPNGESRGEERITTSTQDLIKNLGPIALAAGGSALVQSLLGPAAAGTAGAAGAGGAEALGTGIGAGAPGMGGAGGITSGYSGLGINPGTVGLGAEGLGAGITAGSGLTGTGVLTGSALGTGLLGSSALNNLVGTGVLAGSNLGASLLGPNAGPALTGTGILTGSNLGTSLLGAGAGALGATGVNALAGAGGAGAAGAAGAGAAGAAGAGSTLTSLLTPAALAVSGLVGANAAKSAAETQADSAREANALLYKMYQEQKGLQEPFRGAGITAQNRLLDLLGLSQNKGAEGFGRYAKDFGMSDFTADPGYAFRLAEGQKTLDRQAAARGGLISGGALKAATRYGQDMGSQEYQSAFNRYQTNRANQLQPLGSLLTSGQAAASNQGAAAGSYGAGASGNITGAGAATAAGQVGSANALTNALSSYLNYSSGQNLADAIRKSTYGG
jgi:hypothetical protein